MSDVFAEEDELQSLLGFKQTTCAIAGCENEELDERGPISLTDETGKRRQYTMCPAHWEAILLNLGVSHGHSERAQDQTNYDAELAELAAKLVGERVLQDAGDEPQQEEPVTFGLTSVDDKPVEYSYSFGFHRHTDRDGG